MPTVFREKERRFHVSHGDRSATGRKVRAHSGAPLQFFVTFAICVLPFAMSFAVSSDYPVFVAQVPNPNDYSLFANGAWDGNWYVGYNNDWIKKLPPIPKGNYSRAFVGAKLGRMKTLPPMGRPPQFSPVPGEIWIAVASTPAWKAAQRMQLTTTDDIPLDGSGEYAMENIGESQWFWTEIPLQSINFSGDNYLALWSPTPALVAVSSAPVLAAAWGGKDVNTWIAKDLKGNPPDDTQAATSTPLTYFQPALALKLIPAGRPHPMRVRLLAWQYGTADHPKPVITGSVEGDSVERVWVEYGKAGIQVGRSLWKAPYIFSLDQSKLANGKLQLRLAAVNAWEEKAYSDPLEIEVSPLHAKN